MSSRPNSAASAATPSTDRRSFLRSSAILVAGAVALPERILADPYAPLPSNAAPGEHSLTGDARTIRVRGRVTGGGRGLARVAVSDGRSVVTTDGEGAYELITTTDRPFVFCSTPSGYRIPTHATGTAAHYRPVARGGVGDEREAHFELEPLPGGPRSDDAHALLLLADVQTEDATEMRWFHERTVPDVIETARALGDREVVGVACGDIVFDDLSLFPEYERAVERMGIPFHQVVGNHDLDFENGSDEGSIRTFSRHFGPPYYSFERGAVHYVVLDDVFWHGSGYIGYLPEEQLRWIEADLALVEPGRPVVVLQHIPAVGTRYLREEERSPRPSGSVTNRERLYRLLEPYDAHILSGHIHENDHNWDHGPHEHVAGTVCGAWWSGPICGDGTPNGYAVYEVSGEEVRWRYKSTGHPADHQIRLHPPGSDPAAPDEVVANIWDWAPGWTVRIYEDGEPAGPMARRVGFDPLSLRLHTGEELPPRRRWVDPYPTGHLFYAPLDPETREARVEATDRFGRSYQAVLRL